MKKGEQERGWTQSDDHTPMDKVVTYYVLAPASADEHTLMKETNVGRWVNGAASSDITTIASGTHEIRQGVCVKNRRSL